MFKKKKIENPTVAPEKGVIIECKGPAKVFKIYGLCTTELIPVIRSMIFYVAKQMNMKPEDVLELLE